MARTWILLPHCKGKRALGSIIGTLLLIAITVVGGTITSVYSGDIYNSSQISGNPNIDFLQVLGYDTRISCSLVFYYGTSPCGTAGLDISRAAKQVDERIAVYLVNHSAKKVVLSKVMFGGDVYTHTTSPTLTIWNDDVEFVPGQYAMSDEGTSLMAPENQEIQPGQTVTLVLDLSSDFKLGRTVQFQVTTGNGAIYVNDIKIGEHIVE